MEDEKRGVPSPEGEVAPGETTAVVVQAGGAQPPAVPPPSAVDEDEDPEEQGMLRMSFMEHLEELRSRIIKALYGLLIAFVASLVFAGPLWDIISEPAVSALKHLGVVPPRLVQITPMESFTIIWVQLPLLCSVFLASPWIVYQVWAFISPGLYKRERRWAAPFVLITAGLFILGGVFAYFLAFRFGLEFLLGIGMSNHVQPMVSITEYFDLFVNVTLGVGLVFELPVLIFLLTLLRVASPRFLLRHSRYAILAIVIIAAIVTPTPDVFNLMLFAIPMCALYFVGIFFSFMLVLRREGKQFPWKTVLLIALAVLVIAAAIYFVFSYYHLHVMKTWPYVSR
ncbi:MAG TPA: twin-arginine translocase subunit TatC [Bryobacteraceae bacterium]|nr:twin-arginine translocase subunit TatC [Bryobacteraceae bacterium]